MQPRRGREGLGRTPHQSLVDALARRLVHATVSALPDEIVAALEAVGRRLRADRVMLWESRWPERRLALAHEWSRHGCALPVATITADEHPWLMEQLRAGRRVAFRSCAMLPREAFRERKFYARHGPRSAAILPLVVGDTTEAVLVVGTMRRERSWRRATLSVVEQVGVVLATAIVRKRAHEASVETEGRLAGVLEAGPDAILLADRNGRIQLVNGRATAILFRTRDELRAQRLQDLLVLAPEAAWLAGRSAIDVLLASEGPQQLCARRGDGSTVPVQVTLRELRTAAGELFCCGIRDVSDDRRAQEETTRLRNELAFMSRTALLAEMGSGIAHELNQPLTAILSNAETAQRLLGSSAGRDPDELRETLRDVVNETRRAADVLGRMREMLRRKEVERSPLDLAALLGDVARRFREEAVARAIRISVDVIAGLPPVLGDPVQVEQVVMNLVLNAFEAMGGESPPRTIAIRARRTQPDGVDVSIRDSGPGLDDEALAHAFDTFFTTKPRGLGMGLPISRSIVEAHGGRLLARNNADRGATFEFHLPAAPSAGAADVRGRPS
ncbi:ATP-binding protein [Anaeromyxobacter oryzae]|uniref:histidine kinase n=1 Tax=Anaeromyxobacter oryzae TaxID=2918170 RepID=A0ABM7X1I4_9BACT|nr:ATP-binding protein [Anaeromyxobacter oryzae]BDG05611.1 hypothetical protein AMOR_46070 [Anaeromyxobacter oryzae]